MATATETKKPRTAKRKLYSYKIEWGENKCRVKAANYQEAVRLAFDGSHRWKVLTQIKPGDIPFAVYVEGGLDATGGAAMVITTKRVVESLFGIDGPCEIAVDGGARTIGMRPR